MMRDARGAVRSPSPFNAGEPGSGEGAAAADVALELREVGFKFGAGSKWLFSGLCLTAGPGSSIALVGPSGSGKSTLLAVIGGATVPSAGQVLLNGTERRPTGENSIAAWIPQALGLLLRRSVLENVTLIARVDSPTGQREAIQARAAGLLRELGLEEKIGVPTRQLSGGEAQRVCIARALASDRRLILADEPTGQLDRRLTDVVANALMSAAHRGRIVVIATHDRSVADRCSHLIDLS